MLEHIRSHLRDLLAEVSLFPSKDLLVNLNNERCIPYLNEALNPSPVLLSILKKSRDIERKTGVTPLCTTLGVLSFEEEERTISAPIFIQHVDAELNKETGNYHLHEIGTRELNPYVKSLFFAKDSEEVIHTFSDVISKVTSHSITLHEDKSYLGNFDPKRFAFIREIGTLIEGTNGFSNALFEIYGNEASIPLDIELNPYSLFPQDTAQEKLSKGINDNSHVVQGPPGTGKSQLLSNFLGQILFNKKRTLFISEKQAAIDVICNKLETRDLQVLCFKIPSRNSNRAFVQSIKKSWAFFQNRKEFILQKPSKKIDIVKNNFDLIKQISLDNNCSIANICNILSSSHSLDKGSTIKPDIDIKDLQFFENYENKIPQKLDPIIRILTKESIDLGCEKLISETKHSQIILEELHPLKSWSEIKAYETKALKYHSFNSEIYQKHGRYLNDGGENFQLIYNQYGKLYRKIKTLSKLEIHWKIEPTHDELDVLEKMYQKDKKASTFLLRWWTWRRFTRTSQLNPLEQIKKRKAYLKTIDALDKTIEKFHKIGIQDPIKDLEVINQLIKTTNLKEWLEFKSGNKTIDHKRLYECLNTLKKNFYFNGKSKPLDLLNSLIKESDLLLEYWSEIVKTPLKLLPYWESDLDAVHTKVNAIIKSNLIKSYPSLASFTKKVFLEDIQELNSHSEVNGTVFSKNILTIWTAKFLELEALTRKDPRKLNAEEKAFRKSLKKGKVILTKEFAKKRSHKSIRELLLSDARPWIDVLKPIWMCNPALLADHLPMEKGMYDFIVSDESSQLLLSHSIGAFQRGTKSLICGDPEQMSPSSYFKKKQDVEMSLLHHAYYHLPKIFLSNHYRSTHPKLIEFSNTNFYGNRLKAFQDLCAIKNPIKHHFISDGLYSNRQNIKEAKAIAVKIKSEINNPLKIGIVAFSEIQLELIHDYLDNDTRIKFEKRLKDHTAFSHSLENVQGDECDLLIISLGYGYNEAGKFEMRFGPVNTMGGHKRLNVLFSRSRQEIHFFSSVHLKDFTKTENPGVLLLMKWFEIMERPSKTASPASEIPFDQILKNANGFHDLLTYIQVYEKRGYSITA